jgi:hypothetical protein
MCGGQTILAIERAPRGQTLRANRRRVFDDAPDRIGVLLVTPFIASGSRIAILSANTITPVRKRLRMFTLTQRAWTPPCPLHSHPLHAHGPMPSLRRFESRDVRRGAGYLPTICPPTLDNQPTRGNIANGWRHVFVRQIRTRQYSTKHDGRLKADSPLPHHLFESTL